MDGRMDGWMGGWMDGWMDVVKMDGSMLSKRMDGWGRTDGLIDGWIWKGRMDLERTNGSTN